MDTIIQTKNLSFMNSISYQDISIPIGITNFLSGKSGSGKSTLLKLINATISPSSGTILYNGTDINNIDTLTLRRELLLASQEPFLFDGTIRQNFDFFYDFRDNVCINEEGMKHFLNICCAPFTLDTLCNNLSGGERQRVFMAICLSFMPKLLMLDEPTAALDEATSIQFFKQVKNFCTSQHITLLVISHTPLLIETFADNIITLDKEVSL